MISNTAAHFQAADSLEVTIKEWERESFPDTHCLSFYTNEDGSLVETTIHLTKKQLESLRFTLDSYLTELLVEERGEKRAHVKTLVTK